MRVDDLFDVRYGHSLELNRLQRVDAPLGVNFVSRAMRNNGVTARVEVPSGVVPGRAGELTVALNGNGVLSTFVQPEPFLSAFHVAILAPKRADMTLAEKLWWGRCIYENRYRFSYGRQANRSLAELILPDAVPTFVAATDLPDFDAAKLPAGEPVPLPDASAWGTWTLGDLFTVLKGRRVTKRQRVPGSTPFVGATMRNNGVTDHVDATPMFPAGAITVPYNGNGVAYAFVQRDAFCASDDVQVLVPKAKVDPTALLFVCAVIRGERYRFSYGRKWHLERMRQNPISLPAAGDAPDWALMAAYVRGLPYAAGVAGTDGGPLT